jgi:hypothetical protein
MRNRVRIWLAAALLAGACSDSTGPGDGARRVVIDPGEGTLQALQDTLALSAVVTDASGRPLPGVPVEWASLDPAVASVDALGRVVSRDAGTARITASSGTAADTAEVTVTPAVQGAALAFVRLASTAPEPETRDTSFWAVSGRGGELEIRFAGEDGERFLRFKVGGDALLTYPDGRSFTEGDSVQIRVRLDEEARFVFDFQPSGLRFDPEHPAELEVRYAEADPEDVDLPDELFLWKQEQPDSPWLRLATVRVKDAKEVRAQITGFTGFALATD